MGDISIDKVVKNFKLIDFEEIEKSECSSDLRENCKKDCRNCICKDCDKRFYCDGGNPVMGCGE